MVRQRFIPLFAGKPSHPAVPLERKSAGARSEGQGRPTAGACALPLTAASTLAGWRRSGDRVHVLVLILAGVFACVSQVAIPAQPESAQRHVTAESYAVHIIEASQRFNIPERWIRANMQAERNGDPRAISPKGAMGLMQIMPVTWASLRVRHRLGNNIYDPHDNIIASAGYIRELLDRYGSPGWIATYNAGPARCEASLAGRPLPAEIRAYVAIITMNLSDDGNMGAVVIATNDPRAWTRAPLFVMQPDYTSGTDRASAERMSRGTSGATTTRDVPAVVPQSRDLFVVPASARLQP
jgi:hypothetical protein